MKISLLRAVVCAVYHTGLCEGEVYDWDAEYAAKEVFARRKIDRMPMSDFLELVSDLLPDVEEGRP